jgi:hypothetical protein
MRCKARCTEEANKAGRREQKFCFDERGFAALCFGEFSARRFSQIRPARDFQ